MSFRDAFGIMFRPENTYELIRQSEDRRDGWFREFSPARVLVGVSLSHCQGRSKSQVLSPNPDYTSTKARCSVCQQVFKLMDHLRDKKISFDELPSRTTTNLAAVSPYRDTWGEGFDGDFVYDGDWKKQ